MTDHETSQIICGHWFPSPSTPVCNIMPHDLRQICYIQPVKCLHNLLSLLCQPCIHQMFLLGFNTDILCDTRSEICYVSKNGYLALCGGYDDEWWMMNYMMNDSSSWYKMPLIYGVFSLLCHSLNNVSTSWWKLRKKFWIIFDVFLSCMKPLKAPYFQIKIMVMVLAWVLLLILCSPLYSRKFPCGKYFR